MTTGRQKKTGAQRHRQSGWRVTAGDQLGRNLPQRYSRTLKQGLDSPRPSANYPGRNFLVELHGADAPPRSRFGALLSHTVNRLLFACSASTVSVLVTPRTTTHSGI